ncbi:MAG: exonuclease domain-containing protein, partial [Desulfobacterales bacterium]
FMGELPEGVVICNSEGQILLYNRQAKSILAGRKEAGADERENGDQDESFIGLGRSIFSLVDKNLIVHALDEIADQLERAEENIQSTFVFIGGDDRLFRVEAVPVLNTLRKLTGFILIIFDITRELEQESRMGMMIDSLTRRTRSSAASIRSAIEAILEYSEMEPEQLDRFRQIIHRESLALGELLNQSTEELTGRLKTKWPLVRTRADDFLETVRKKTAERLGIEIEIACNDPAIEVRIDSYSLVLAFLFLIQQLRAATGCIHFRCQAERTDRLVNLDIRWQGDAVAGQAVRTWEKQILSVGAEQFPLTLETVLRHHEADLWSRTSLRAPGQACLRILIPVLEHTEPEKIRRITILPDSRPEFYDFDLFNQPGQNPELDECLLRELAYTVFDTETTGLNPSGGDEIISIGAVRIVNGRLLRDEVFDQLVNPRRPMPRESVKIHGIQPEMLENQPGIELVLPRFHRFAEGTILVAHNAAFDMKMLQLKEAPTGVRFINPVLDTLLLSAAVHPAHNSHNLEDIAARMGISIVGRHTALGDAIATAEVFLKLLSILAKSGVHSLKQAREASQRTYYARKKY